MLDSVVAERIFGELEGKCIVTISAGYRHSAAVTEDGILYTWGEGDFGRLGHGDGQSRDVPTAVKDIGPVSQIACGAAHTLALSDDGRTIWYVALDLRKTMVFKEFMHWKNTYSLGD